MDATDKNKSKRIILALRTIYDNFMKNVQFGSRVMQSRMVRFVIIFFICIFFYGIPLLYVFSQDEVNSKNITLLLSFVAGVALSLQAALSAISTKVQTDSRLDNKFEKSVSMLDSDNLVRRIGGIYALRNLAQNHPDYCYAPVTELLCAFVRHSNYEVIKPTCLQQTDMTPDNASELKLRADIAAVVEFIRLRPRALLRWEKLNSVRPDFCGSDLAGANFEGAVLVEATLTNTDLTSVCLADADITGACLSGAKLAGATGLTQDMLSSAKPSHPPASLPEGLYWPFDKCTDGFWKLKG